ncbi:circularly permuted type 2 ATP-grasp protein [Magnetospirillum sp. 64-120]|uniref:circularly permuted type 2 ATP-grasp protein n=1 Tax=Magnetospirillum sp. 64-120 TaxID=1895778 RepID=UPI00092917FD|nr:circularly permuted type 2 ATP-grasp protein [Magnetospirillum sp. 64-120]OJX70474.1 MAG: hypothetical protein BGO92_18040 [Magnetospirillum sp. 64-120]
MYAPPVDAHDEMLAANGQVRPHWRAFLDSFARLSPEDLVQRWELGQNLLRDNGVTYNVHGDPEGLDRPWTLDPLPLLLPAPEWDGIARGIAQRAGLLNDVLADLYGSRTLIGLGLIPPALLHANPAFLRPCHGWMPAGGHHLHIYAADLVRGTDGQWRVLADRTESPAGAGYALENRTIVNRILPEQFRSTHVERLAPFFEAMRRSLNALSPRRTDTPTVVLLTPGPYNETFFEHAFLARHLGLTLAQGEDLTVRDGNVYMKTLTGLQQVDVVVRRTNGEWCDPLELRGDSTLGVAGLVQSARAGNVAVVNALGSGLLDGGAIQSFLPGIARHLLGESLMIPSVPSWWCGNDQDRAFVTANLDQLVLRPAFHNRVRPRLGSLLDDTERQAALDDIAQRPTDWVAQQVDSLSTVPVWNDGRFEPRSMVLRVFAVSTENGWQVMPGGLARVSSRTDLLTARLQTGGGGSKDLWILADNTSPQALQTRGRAAPVKLVRGNRDLPSRVADNIFWLGRYIERCENQTRLLRAAIARIEEALDQNDPARAVFTARIMARLGLHIPRTALEAPETLPGALAAHHLGGGEDGLAQQVERLLRAALNLRDRLSVDTWRALQRLRDDVRRLHQTNLRGDTQTRLHDLILTVESLSGLSMENMTRGPLWLFMDSGRRVERAITIVDTLAGALTDADSEDAVPMDLLLELWDSAMTYRSRYLSSPRLAAVLDLLLCDESNPRSLGFQLAALEDHMDNLARIAGENGFLRPEQRLMTVLCGTVRTTDAVVLARYDRDAGYMDAERLLENFRSRLWEVTDLLSREYFSHAQWRLPVRPPELLA